MVSSLPSLLRIFETRRLDEFIVLHRLGDDAGRTTATTDGVVAAMGSSLSTAVFTAIDFASALQSEISSRFSFRAVELLSRSRVPLRVYVFHVTWW